MIILKKNIKLLNILLILIVLSYNCNLVYAAGTATNEYNEISLYKAGKSLVIRAKKQEKKNRNEKAKKLYLKAYDKFEKAYYPRCDLFYFF